MDLTAWWWAKAKTEFTYENEDPSKIKDYINNANMVLDAHKSIAFHQNESRLSGNQLTKEQIWHFQFLEMVAQPLITWKPNTTLSWSDWAKFWFPKLNLTKPYSIQDFTFDNKNYKLSHKSATQPENVVVSL